jgi:signal transduction histidine kinase/CheY-like chemotaxis protein
MKSVSEIADKSYEEVCLAIPCRGAIAAVLAALALVSACNPPELRVRIGFDHAPPYYYRDGDGRQTGFAYEALEEAARRSRVKLDWRECRSPEHGLDEKNADLWPALSPSPERARRYYFSAPYLRNPLALFGLQDGSSIRPSDLRDLEVGHRRGSFARMILSTHVRGSIPIEYGSSSELMEGVCRGEVKAGLTEIRFMERFLLNRPPACSGIPLQLRVIEGVYSPVAVAARPGFERAADRLREGLGSMIRDGSLDRIVERHSPLSSADVQAVGVMRAAERRNRQFLGLVMILLAAIVMLGWLYLRARQARRAALLARRRAEDANFAKSQFLANMSHEIRTPLTGVIGMTEQALDGPLTEQKRATLEIVRESARLLLTVLNDILDLAKIEAGAMRIENIRFEPRRTIGQAVNLMRAQAATKGIELTATIEDCVPSWLLGDPYRVQQIVLNLVGNAIKFTSCGKVTVTAACTGEGWLEITVSDTGIGIPADKLALLFRKFSQVDASMSRRYGGTGLGLAIARDLATLMGGGIRVESCEGEGSKFTVSLPLPATSPPAVGPEEPVFERLTGLRVLLVEDNSVNRIVVERLLQKLGCETQIAANGREAIEMAASADVILMDCQMPEMDGLEATRRIRTSGLQTPIIALTAHALSEEERNCREAGMDDFLTKPLDLAALDAALRRWTKKPSLA